MTFTANSGRIQITNQFGETVFDTDEGLFVVTNRLSGSITLPQRADSNSPSLPPAGTAWQADYLVGLCNPDATMVRGVFRVTVPGGQGNVTDIGAFNANGTYMHYTEANPSTSSGENDHVQVSNLAAYTFHASGGQVYIREDVVLCGKIRLGTLTYTVTLRAPTFSYNLFVGTFV